MVVCRVAPWRGIGRKADWVTNKFPASCVSLCICNQAEGTEMSRLRVRVRHGGEVLRSRTGRYHRDLSALGRVFGGASMHLMSARVMVQHYKGQKRCPSQRRCALSLSLSLTFSLFLFPSLSIYLYLESHVYEQDSR